MPRRVNPKIAFLLLLLSSSAAVASPGIAMTPTDWVERYRDLVAQAPMGCPSVSIPTLPEDVPANAFPLEAHAGSSSEEPWLVLVKDSIAERVIFLAVGADGCVRAGASGRVLPFADRSRPSPFPNLLLPAVLGATPPVVVIADRKSIRPWIEIIAEPEVDRGVAQYWMVLGAYAGMLLVLLLVGIGFVVWQRARLAIAYVV